VSLDGQLDHERATYFSAISATTGRRYEPGYDATPFATYFIGAIVRATDHALARMRGLGQVLLAVRRPIITGEIPAPMLDGLAYAWINNSIRPTDYAQITGRSASAATRDLSLVARLPPGARGDSDSSIPDRPGARHDLVGP